MDVLKAIHTRRSVGRVKPEPLPPKADIAAMLEAATWAPNHFLTQPWRFWVLTGEARERLGEAMAEAVREQLASQGETASPERLEAERKKALRAPVLIAVAAVPAQRPGVVPTEELCATAAAIQNMLLVAHARGLGAMWRTGMYAYHPRVKAFFGLPEEAYLVGFVYVGYPVELPDAPPRTAYTEHTTWLGLRDW